MALQDTSISIVNKQEALKLKDDGNALFKEQKFIKAAGSYTKAAKKDPSNPILHCNLAMALLKISKFDKAALAAQKCVDLDPEFEKGHYRLALAFLGAEKYAEAITAFEETARINPNNKDAVKKVQVAAWECRKFHKAEGTEPPECALKYRKEDTPAEVEAKEAKAKVKKEDDRQKMNFKFPATKPAAVTTVNDVQFPGATQMAATAAELAANAADMPEETGETDVSTKAEVEEAMQRLREGKAVTYSTERVARFMAHEIEELCKPENATAYAYPIAVFLPGAIKPDWGEAEGQGVSMRRAFDSVSTHQNAIPFLRNYADQTNAHAMLMIALKSQIAYPQVWTRKDKKWPYADTPGYFVQLDACKPEDRRVWFIEMIEKEGAPTTYMRHMLDDYYYSIIQPVLKALGAERDFAADRKAAAEVAAAAGVPTSVTEDQVAAENFDAVEAFAGPREGWAFKAGPNGVGYYKDS